MDRKFTEKKLLIASNNPGKVKEIKSLLKPYDIEIFSVTNFDIEEPEETGLSFFENSELKAKYYSKSLNLPALADDSGLCIEALDGYPGIYSARVVGPDKDYNKAYDVIRDKLLKKGLSSSPAHFICSLVLCSSNGEIQEFEGRIDGIISFPALGDKGFGFDPIFTPNGYDKRFAQMDPELKSKISHRALAFKKFIDTCF